MQSALIVNESELERTVTRVLSSLVEEIKNSHPPLREIMTIDQLAELWQVTRQSINNWMVREHYPLPCHYVGGNPRFHLTEVNEWSKAEAARRLSKSESQDVTDLVQ